MEQENFIVLIIKQVSNDISAEELQVLDEWLQASPENRQLANAYRLTWDTLPSDRIPLLKPDLDASFARLMKKVEASSKTTPVIPMWRRVSVRAAAAVAVLAISIWGVRSLMTPEWITVSADGLDKKEIVLPDQSKVWLKKGSKLTYASGFNSTDRKVKVNGEAYFEVAHDPAHHFFIETNNGANIEVLGTAFNVKPIENVTVVTVTEGKIKFVPDPKRSGEKIVAAGYRVIYEAGSGEMHTEKCATNNDAAWQRGGLEFEYTPVKQVIEEMEQYYGISIEVKNPKILTCTYSTTKILGTVEEAISGLCTSFNMKYINPSPSTFVLEGGTCL